MIFSGYDLRTVILLFNNMTYIPTKEELKSLGLSERYYGYLFDITCYDGETIDAKIEYSDDFWQLSVDVPNTKTINVYPQSKSYIDTLIRLLTYPNE